MKFFEINDLSEVVVKNVGFNDKVSALGTIVGFSIVDDCINELYFSMISQAVIAKLYFDAEDLTLEVNDVSELIKIYDRLVELEFNEILLSSDKFIDANEFICLARRQVENEMNKKVNIGFILKNGIDSFIAKVPDIDAKKIEKWMKQFPMVLEKISPENRELISRFIK